MEEEEEEPYYGSRVTYGKKTVLTTSEGPNILEAMEPRKRSAGATPGFSSVSTCDVTAASAQKEDFSSSVSEPRKSTPRSSSEKSKVFLLTTDSLSVWKKEAAGESVTEDRCNSTCDEKNADGKIKKDARLSGDDVIDPISAVSHHGRAQKNKIHPANANGARSKLGEGNKLETGAKSKRAKSPPKWGPLEKKTSNKQTKRFVLQEESDRYKNTRAPIKSWYNLHESAPPSYVVIENVPQGESYTVRNDLNPCRYALRQAYAEPYDGSFFLANNYNNKLPVIAGSDSDGVMRVQTNYVPILYPAPYDFAGKRMAKRSLENKLASDDHVSNFRPSKLEAGSSKSGQISKAKGNLYDEEAGGAFKPNKLRYGDKEILMGKRSIPISSYLQSPLGNLGSLRKYRMKRNLDYNNYR